MEIVLQWVGALALAALALWLVDRLLLWMERRGWIYWRRSNHRTTVTVGNALLEIQSFVNPGAREVIEARRREESEESESGDPPEAGDPDAEREGAEATTPEARAVEAVGQATGFELVPIGHAETPYATLDDCPKFVDPDGPECRLVLDPPFDEALFGLEAGDAIMVLCWLDLSDRTPLRQRRRGEGPIRGTFDLRSPNRPNPIGVAMVRIENIVGNVVVVRGLDCLDGTPLLDIKPLKPEEFPP